MCPKKRLLPSHTGVRITIQYSYTSFKIRSMMETCEDSSARRSVAGTTKTRRASV